MKAKISLGSGGIKGLVVKHVEKAMVALAVFFFVLLVWKAAKLGGDFDKQPDQLQTVSIEAEKAIKEPKKGPPSDVPPWADFADGIKKPVPSGPYPLDETWMHSLFPGETLRGQPEVFPVEKLRASTGFGGIAVSASAGLGGSGETAGPGAYEMEGGDEEGYGGYGAGGKAEGYRWVVITGLLPYKKQFFEYGDLFRNAELKAPRRDVPSYTYCDVERAEVVLGVEPKEEDWKSLKVLKEVHERPRRWAGSQPEIVFGKFLHRSAGLVPMAYRLPPLVGKTFGPEIAHEPEIPLYYEVERRVEREEIDWDNLTPEEMIEAKNQLGGMAAAGQGGYGSAGGYGEEYGGGYEQDYGSMMGGSGSGGMMGGYGGGSMMSGGEDYDEEGGYGGGMGGYGGEMSGYGGEMGGYGGTTGPRREIPEYQLFRFFDFTVLPGRYYQYRVRVRLANPNFELPVQNLEDEKLAEQPFLDTAWSTETKVVSVPLDSRVLAGPISVSTNINTQPRGELGTVFFNEEDGEEVAEKFDVVCGQLLNYLAVEIKEEKSTASLYGGYGEDMGMEEGGYGDEGYGEYGSGPAGAGRTRDRRRERKPKDEIETVDYVTQMLVLDISGGGLLPGPDRNLKGPGRVLLMDPAGNLVLQEELVNQEEWIEFFPPEVKVKPQEESGYGEEGGYGSYMGGEDYE